MFKTAYDHLCGELGGPADIGIELSTIERDLRRYCQDYPPPRILPLLHEYQPDLAKARQHWPWAAFALGQYVWEVKERAKYGDELAPKQVKELLSDIGQLAHKLSSALCQLQQLSLRLPDHNAARRRGHLGWLQSFLSQGLDVAPSTEPKADETILFFENLLFIRRLAQLEAYATAASGRVDTKSLGRERGPINPALRSYVARCGTIWKSLTGRKPSANKVHRRSGSEDPDFVVFVQKLGAVGGAPKPTRREVEKAL